MDYYFKCKNCGKSTQSHSSEEEVPKKVSCMNCFHIHEVIDYIINLDNVVDTNKIDERYKEQVEKVLKHNKND